MCCSPLDDNLSRTAYSWTLEETQKAQKRGLCWLPAFLQLQPAFYVARWVVLSRQAFAAIRDSAQAQGIVCSIIFPSAIEDPLPCTWNLEVIRLCDWPMYLHGGRRLTDAKYCHCHSSLHRPEDPQTPWISPAPQPWHLLLLHASGYPVPRQAQQEHLNRSCESSSFSPSLALCLEVAIALCWCHWMYTSFPVLDVNSD